MNSDERREFESLATPGERAAWLLGRPIEARTDIDPATLGLVWRVYAAGAMLPVTSGGTEAEAVAAGRAWLERKARGAGAHPSFGSIDNPLADGC